MPEHAAEHSGAAAERATARPVPRTTKTKGIRKGKAKVKEPRTGKDGKVRTPPPAPCHRRVRVRDTSATDCGTYSALDVLGTAGSEAKRNSSAKSDAVRTWGLKNSDGGLNVFDSCAREASSSSARPPPSNRDARQVRG